MITHILQNAQRYRKPGTSVVLALAIEGEQALVSVSNTGPQISPELIDRVFEYGVSDPSLPAGPESKNRGQGLYVVKTYMAKMGGTASVSNAADGVEFSLSLPLARFGNTLT